MPGTSPRSLRSSKNFTARHANKMRRVNDGGSWFCEETKPNAACSFCAHKFRWWPTGIPVKWTNNDIFYSKGNFCSFNCALSSIYRDKGPLMHERASFLYALHRFVYSDPLRGLKRSPPTSQLVLFGGSRRVNHWRRDFDIMLSPADWRTAGTMRKTDSERVWIRDNIMDVAYLVKRAKKTAANTRDEQPQHVTGQTIKLRRQKPRR